MHLSVVPPSVFSTTGPIRVTVGLLYGSFDDMVPFLSGATTRGLAPLGE
jgi:hypothetical protein